MFRILQLLVFISIFRPRIILAFAITENHENISIVTLIYIFLVLYLFKMNPHVFYTARRYSFFGFRSGCAGI